jgi:hypothetical protein
MTHRIRNVFKCKSEVVLAEDIAESSGNSLAMYEVAECRVKVK